MEAGSYSRHSRTRATPKADGKAELRDAKNFGQKYFRKRGHPLSLTYVGQGLEEIDQFPKVGLTLGLAGCAEMISRINDDVPDDVFTSILQLLSTSWMARLSPISAQDDKEKNKLTIDFQKQFGELSKDWNSFGPVFISRHHCVTYHRPSDTWQSMPPMSFLPENILVGSALQLDGPLLFVSRPETSSLLSWHESREYVANLVTRNWKCLPARPPADGQCLVRTLVTYPSLQMYKVIVFHGDSDPEIPHLTSQIYDSKSDTWSSNRHYNFVWKDGVNYTELSNPVNFNGVLCMYVDKNPVKLLTFDIERTQLRSVELQVSSGFSDSARQLMAKGCPVDLVVCHGELFAVVFVSRNRFRGANQILVWKVIMGSLAYRQGPPYLGMTNNESEIVNQAFSDGKCIFFRVAGGSRMLEYNMENNNWRYFNLPESVSTAFSPFRNYKQEDERGFPPRDPRNFEWNLSSFRPGLNPFMTV